MTRPAVLFGGPSPEHDISISTGLQAARTLGDVEAIYWDKTGAFHLVDAEMEVRDFADGVPRKARELAFVPHAGGGFVFKKKPLAIDVIVLATHGGPGEDGTLQGMLDLAGCRYTGPGQWGSALGMDKLTFGAAVAAIGLPTLPRVLLQADRLPDFEGPYIVKPRFGGSSIGIEIVEDIRSALDLARVSPHLSDGAVVEPFLAGCRDLQIGVRTHPELQLSAIEEPVRSEGGLYSYEQKYLAWGGSGQIARRLPAELPSELEEELRATAPAVAQLVGVRGLARIDFLATEGRLYVNEINTIPGSLGTYLWVDPPIERSTLLRDMVQEARRSAPRRFSTAGADGTALRNAGTVASKLG
jgi:D-alanine-D-alanine ligase